MERINLRRTIKKISKYEVISFDIFDTLIKRNLSEPKSLYDYVEKEYNRIHPAKKVSEFRTLRSEAEREARNSHPLEEVTFDEIYSFLSLPKHIKTELQKLEKTLEVKFCEPNHDIVYIYRKCRSLKKRVILVSDMYLPQVVIENMLYKCGIAGYEKLYLSSEIGVQKKDGRLYDFVIQDLGVKSSSIFHIGDRKKTDNLIPRFKGMGSIYVPHFYRYTTFLTQTDLKETKSSLFPYVNNQLPKYRRKSEVFRWGYETLGPIIIGFCSWIHKMVEKHQIDTLLFLSRDMYIFVDIYRQLYGSEGKNVVYLEVSRKSLRNAYILKKGTLKAIFDTMTRKAYTIDELLEAMDISSNELPSLSEGIKSHLNRNDKVRFDDQNIEWFEELDRLIIPALKRKENNTYRYLEQMGVVGAGKNAVIDIGWHGTIQNMMETICGKKMTGLYMGISKRNTFDDMDVYGYWFRLKNEVDQNMLLSVTYIFETILFPHLGTTTDYELKEGRYCPVYEEKEVIDYTPIKQFQNGARRFVLDYISFFGKEINIRSSEAVRAFIRLAFEPGIEQVKAFSRLQYEEGIIENMIEAESLQHYIFHPVDFIRDYKVSRWKEGVIKQVLPWVKNPHQLNEMLRKVKELLG